VPAVSWYLATRRPDSGPLLPLVFALVGLACGQSTGTSSSSPKGGSGGASVTSSGGSGGQTDTARGGSGGGGSGGSSEAGGSGGRSEQGGSGGSATGGALAGRSGTGGMGGGQGTGGITGNGGAPGLGGTGSGGIAGSGGTSVSSMAGRTGTGGTSASGGSATPGTGGKADAAAPGPEAGAEAGAPEYLPCPTDGSACKILPYGDSITQGFPFAAQGGYRAPLFHLALADKKKITLIGSLSDGPNLVDGVTFPKNHEGHFAMTIEWLTSTSNVPDRAIQPAHIVLLHAGTNNRSGQPADAAKKLEALIDRIIAVAPNALLFVATILPCGDNGPEDAFVRAFDPLIPPIVEKRAKEGKHIRLVDQYASFTPSTMFSPPEKYHPNLVGYAHMADVWYAAIKSVLPQ
jgi:hypothetical protein